MMKISLYCVSALLTILLASCNHQISPVPAPEPALPQMKFLTPPTIKNNKLKTEIAISKLSNQYMTFSVGLQTLWSADGQEAVEDMGKLLTHGEVWSTSTEPIWGKATTLSLDHNLAENRLSKQVKKVRLKIVMAQAGGTPKSWKQAKAHIFFSQWIKYKAN